MKNLFEAIAQFLNTNEVNSFKIVSKLMYSAVMEVQEMDGSFTYWSFDNSPSGIVDVTETTKIEFEELQG